MQRSTFSSEEGLCRASLIFWTLFQNLLFRVRCAADSVKRRVIIRLPPGDTIPPSADVIDPLLVRMGDV